VVRERGPVPESKDPYPISVTVRPQDSHPLPERWENSQPSGIDLASMDPSTAFSSASADENFAQDDIVVGFMCLFVYLLESRMTLTSTGREGHDLQSCRPEAEEIAASAAGGQECGSSQRSRPQRLKPIIRSALYGATEVAPFPFLHVARTTPTCHPERRKWFANANHFWSRRIPTRFLSLCRRRVFTLPGGRWENPLPSGIDSASRDPSTAFSSASADENSAQDDIAVGFMCPFAYLLESRMTLTSTGREGHDLQSCRPEPEEIAASAAGGRGMDRANAVGLSG